ncbi:hypothetical protein CASFOL_019091 [Castilleja foliolosa]|uniref:KIB1-4 beta-propeller domain-containing protein n=1 Tax=Castilleja foliolosa TaxID=1961234 RepID=A0ABD3D468_9LAMI
MALSSSVPLPFTCPKVKIGSSSSSSSNYCLLGNWWGASLFNRRALGTTAIEAVPKQESSSPWLMLPPKFGSYYKFYKLADNKVDTLSPSDAIRELPITCCRGSTHGWLALLGNDTCILYNPISRRHIKLPSILNLPRMPYQDEENTDFSDITKMILTCSPDDEDEENCRALIINNWANALAFCWPGRSKEWTLMLDENNNNREANIFYDDCVYSPRLKLFFALTNRRKIETWDFGEPASSPPKLIKVDKCYLDTSLETSPFQSLCDDNDYLVSAGEDILYVIQYAMTPVGPDGSYLHDTVSGFPHVTVRFDIFKYDRKKGKFKYVDGSSSSCLGGYAIFVGALSHSVAIPATRFPELKPDSIYFTDGYFPGSFDGYDDDYHFDDELVRGHDIGIYNYQDKTVSPCYYPCDVPSLKTIMPPPTWFFPN